MITYQLALARSIPAVRALCWPKFRLSLIPLTRLSRFPKSQISGQGLSLAASSTRTMMKLFVIALTDSFSRRYNSSSVARQLYTGTMIAISGRASPLDP